MKRFAYFSLVLLGMLLGIAVEVSSQGVNAHLKSQLFQGDATLEAAMVSDPAHILPGSTGEYVGKIQTALIALDGAVIDPTEREKLWYGPSTAAAVLAYKKKRGIINHSYQTQADNIVGRMTMASFDAEMEKKEHEPPPSPSPHPSITTGAIDVRLRVFIPSRAVLVPVPGARDFGYAGDNRDFSYDTGTSRAELWVDAFNANGSGSLLNIKRRAFGQTEKYRTEDIESVGGKPEWWKVVKKDPFLHLEKPPIEVGTAQMTHDTLAVSGRMESQPLNPQNVTHLTFHINAANPLESLAPAIDCQLDVLFIRSTNGLSYSINGSHDGFPAYELYIERHLVYSYDPVKGNAGPLALGGQGNIAVNIPWTAITLP